MGIPYWTVGTTPRRPLTARHLLLLLALLAAILVEHRVSAYVESCAFGTGYRLGDKNSPGDVNFDEKEEEVGEIDMGYCNYDGIP